MSPLRMQDGIQNKTSNNEENTSYINLSHTSYMCSIRYKFTTSDEEYSCPLEGVCEGEILSDEEICCAVLNHIFGTEHPCTLEILNKQTTDTEYMVTFKRVYKERFAIPSFPVSPKKAPPKKAKVVRRRRWRSRSPPPKRWHSPGPFRFPKHSKPPSRFKCPSRFRKKWRKRGKRY